MSKSHLARSYLVKRKYVDFYKKNDPTVLRGIYFSDIDSPFGRVYYEVNYNGGIEVQFNSELVMDKINSLMEDGYIPIGV